MAEESRRWTPIDLSLSGSRVRHLTGRERTGRAEGNWASQGQGACPVQTSFYRHLPFFLFTVAMDGVEALRV